MEKRLKKNRKSKQTFKYIKEESIVYNQVDDYDLTKEEYIRLHTFYVTHSMGANQSRRQKMFTNYGWSDDTLKAKKTVQGQDKTLCEELENILNTKENGLFIYSESEDLKILYKKADLLSVTKQNVNEERFVISKTKGNNIYLKLFYRIRNCLAHGNYALMYSMDDERMIIMQDNDKDNVNSRIILKLSTILNFVHLIT